MEYVYDDGEYRVYRTSWNRDCYILERFTAYRTPLKGVIKYNWLSAGNFYYNEDCDCYEEKYIYHRPRVAAKTILEFVEKKRKGKQ